VFVTDAIPTTPLMGPNGDNDQSTTTVIGKFKADEPSVAHLLRTTNFADK